MGGGIDRGQLQLLANADGSVAPLAVVFPSMVETPDGEAPRGVVILALETDIGSPAPSEPFSCALLDAHGEDRLWGAGSRRQLRRHRTIIQGASGRHPVVAAGETLSFVIEGTHPPGAVVYVSLYFAEINPSSNAAEEQVH